MSIIQVKATLVKSDDTQSALIVLPKDASDKLPSRGMVMVDGLINDKQIRVLLQPNGQFSHWFALDSKFLKSAGFQLGDTLNIELKATKEWPEPKVEKEMEQAIQSDPKAQSMWRDITPMARWDWINWMDAVKLPETRKARPDKLVSMLKAGKRRPCCFNRSARANPRAAELV